MTKPKYTFLENLREYRRVLNFRTFHPLKCGKYRLSIQASAGHYCYPKELLDSREYSSMELAIFNRSGYFNPWRSRRIYSYPRFNEIWALRDGDFNGSVVYGRVPLELLEDFYLWMKQIR